MLVSEVRKLSPIDRLLYWMKERESIRLKKEAGEPWPWTDDEILRKYRFTNVRRMDDRVSRWLMDNWYRPYFDHPNMLVSCTLARHFNLPEALGAVGFPERWEPESIKRKLRAMKANGECIFNGAYMIRGVGGIDKVEMVVELVCQPLVNGHLGIDPESMERSVDSLLAYWGLSSFLAGQVVADMRWAVKGVWMDKYSWAPVGPGSRRGMNRLHGRPIDQPLEQGRFSEELMQLRERCEKTLPKTMISRLEAIDLQNCCCEYDKYIRTLLGEGAPKQLYKPHEVRV